MADIGTDLYMRLKAYEDTGLEPEEVERYTKAEKDGRLLVPPCKVGDMVFLIVQGMSSPMPVPVCSLTWRGGKWSINADREETEPPKVVGFQIGKTAFLNREDAEKSLEEAARMTELERMNYCKNCDRSIYGKYHDCDVNIENGGKYVHADDKCYCKIVNGKRAEKYPWEGGGEDG